jgi:hypothetical protein
MDVLSLRANASAGICLPTRCLAMGPYVTVFYVMKQNYNNLFYYIITYIIKSNINNLKSVLFIRRIELPHRKR